MADLFFKPELDEEKSQWENHAEWETLFRDAFVRDDASNAALDTLDWGQKGPKGRVRASNWTQAEINLLYELFFPRYEDWRPTDVQPSVRSLRKRSLLIFLETELKNANLNDPPKTTVQIDDKLKNDFKKIREKIVGEEKGKPAFSLPPPLNLFEELVRNDSTKMSMLKVRYLDTPIGYDPVSSSGCILLDDDSLEGPSPSSKAKDPPVLQNLKPNDDDDAEKDIVDIEELLNNRGEPPMKKSRSLEAKKAAFFASINAISGNSPLPAMPASKFQRDLDEAIEQKSKAVTSKQAENEEIEKAFQVHRFANEKQRSQLIEREKMLLSLKEEVLHAKLEAARAKRRYYEKKTQLTCSSINPNGI